MKKKINLTEREKEVVLSFAENNMNVSKTARVLYLHLNSVIYHIERIREKYNVDPKNFYDLCELLQQIKSGDEEAPVNV